MRIGITSSTVGNPAASLNDLIDEIKSAEAQGFAFISLPNIFGLDAITAIAIAGRETSRIELATGVVPSPPRHPVALAQQAMTAQAACQGRFVLGIGLSHKVVIETMLGLSYARPASQMREYLEVLMPILGGKPASVQGEHYNVNAGIQVVGGSPLPVLVAALGPKMLKVTGELADGTTTWMTGVKTLGEHIVPTINAAASSAGRDAPRILAAIPVALTDDADAAREACNQAFAMYPSLPSYKAMLDREGVEDPAGVALIGDESTVRSGIARFRDAGITDFAASPFPAGPGSIERSLALLRDELSA
jgi:5,10-methylenetetrahydromethanopterin reductase